METTYRTSTSATSFLRARMSVRPLTGGRTSVVLLPADQIGTTGVVRPHATVADEFDLRTWSPPV